jgi:ABC-2 type transport system permease protein
MTVADARIHDQGYRRYDGPRLGPSHAVRALARHTFQRILGLRRPARYKVLPFLCVIIAYLPAAVFVGIIALVPDGAQNARITYAQYYGFVTAAIFLFVTFVAPEAMCPDRHWRSLSLYLSSPLNRLTYLLSKAIAIVGALLLVTVGPLLLLLVGFVLQNRGPDGPGNVALTLFRILAGGLVMSLNFAAISMAVSSITDRRAFAAAATLLLLLLSHALAGFFVFGINASQNFYLVSLVHNPVDLVQRFFGKRTFENGPPGLDLATWPLGVAVAVTTIVAAVLVVWRYRKVQVTR